MKTSHPDPPEAVYYWEKKKQGQISDLSRALDISSATALVALCLLKDLAIISHTTVKRSAVHWEDLKPYWKSDKSHISVDDQQSYYLQVFQRFCWPKKED